MLDGANIRSAREAKGMSQAVLAEKVGTTQQTIEKIESGKVERTTYLPEIRQALDMDASVGVSPLMVLRTILCANPTAEQILAALAANGLTVVAIGERVAPCTLAAEFDDPRAFVKEIIARRKIEPSNLARNVGLAPSTLNKFLKNAESPALLSVRTLQKIKEWDQGQ